MTFARAGGAGWRAEGGKGAGRQGARAGAARRAADDPGGRQQQQVQGRPQNQTQKQFSFHLILSNTSRLTAETNHTKQDMNFCQKYLETKQ